MSVFPVFRNISFPSDPLAACAYVLVFLLTCAPFLVPVHIWPITTFYSEWWAAVIGLGVVGIAIAAATRHGSLVLPKIVILPAVFLFGTMVQLAVGRIHFPQQGLIYACYLLLAAGMMVAGFTLRQYLPKLDFVGCVGGGIAVGALIQAAIAILQINNEFLVGFTTPLINGSAPYGNLGQRNHLANLMWQAIACLLFLGWSGRLRPLLAAIGIALLIGVSPFTGSRSVYLYPLGFVVAIAATWPRFRQLPRSNVLAMCCLALLPVLAAWDNFAAVNISTLSGSRAHSGESLISTTIEPHNDSIKIAQWKVGIAAALDAPWLGHGVGSAPLSSLLYGNAGNYSAGIVVNEHFHNIVVNALAEFGFPITLCALLITYNWLRKLLNSGAADETWWVLAVISVVSIHSLLEYPLWHTYFLAPFSLLLGAYCQPGTSLRLGKGMITILAVAALLSAQMLHTLREDHRRLARVLFIVPVGADAQAVWQSKIQDLLDIHRHSLFSPYVNGMLVSAMDVDNNLTDEKQTLCRAALHFSPTHIVISKCAALYALANRQAEAKQLLRLGWQAYPAERRELQNEWRSYTERYPEIDALEKWLE